MFYTRITYNYIKTNVYCKPTSNEYNYHSNNQYLSSPQRFPILLSTIETEIIIIDKTLSRGKYIRFISLNGGEGSFLKELLCVLLVDKNK